MPLLTANDVKKKQVAAARHAEQIKIDGNLTETPWQSASRAGEFIQNEPKVGVPATFRSEVSVIYDDAAIYIGARLYDPEPDKILKELSIRDNLANADNFAIFFDPYNSGLNGFLFRVTASGVQLDAIVSNHEEDFNWNAVWDSAVRIHEEYWSVELKIPFSSLRFIASGEQNWGIQFEREIRRFRELSHWSAIDPLIQGWVQQCGQLTDLKNIKTPVRLNFFPYLSAYVDNYSDKKNGINTTNTAYNAGMDIKYGINDAFTLDMTLIPDFGQVISDRQVLNLTPFEVFFEENRQFFTEGTELFNKGSLFYSRRIGGRPLHFNKVAGQLQPGEVIISNPDVSQLFNATKITGRTQSGVGLGFFNAVVGETHAVIRNEIGEERQVQTNPLTNYNAVVLDKNLKNNSYISLMNTNVLRNGRDYDANATGAYFDFKDKDQTYSINGNVSLTQKFNNGVNDAGYAYNLKAGKISGKWLYEAGHGIVSVKYDPNDMGFLLRPNSQYYYGQVQHQEFKPRREKLQRWNYTFWASYNTLYQPKKYTDFRLGLDNFYLWKSRNAVGGFIYADPYETRDFFEPRTFDFVRYVVTPPSIQAGGFFSSDYRKPVALDINITLQDFSGGERSFRQIRFAPRFRLNDKISIFPNFLLSYAIKEPGYVNKSLVSSIGLDISPNDVLMGVRNRLIAENTITFRWIFNHNMGINTRIRHYYDNVQNQYYGTLDDRGRVEKIVFDGKNAEGVHVFDRNVNIFNIDMQFNWRFLPGSDMIVVWKNQIFTAGNRDEIDYFRNLGSLANQAQENNLSVRVLFFVDYLYLQKYTHSRDNRKAI